MSGSTACLSGIPVKVLSKYCLSKYCLSVKATCVTDQNSVNKVYEPAAVQIALAIYHQHANI